MSVVCCALVWKICVYGVVLIHVASLSPLSDENRGCAFSVWLSVVLPCELYETYIFRCNLSSKSSVTQFLRLRLLTFIRYIQSECSLDFFSCSRALCVTCFSFWLQLLDIVVVAVCCCVYYSTCCLLHALKKSFGSSEQCALVLLVCSLWSGISRVWNVVLTKRKTSTRIISLNASFYTF